MYDEAVGQVRGGGGGRPVADAAQVSGGAGLARHPRAAQRQGRHEAHRRGRHHHRWELQLETSVADPKPDPTLKVITGPDPPFQIILDPDRSRIKIKFRILFGTSPIL